MNALCSIVVVLLLLSNPLQASQRMPYPKPKLTALNAIEAVTKHTQNWIDPKYYVDRVWLNKSNEAKLF